MLRRLVTQSLCPLRARAAFSTATVSSFDVAAAQERQRERRKKDRAEPEATIGIEGTTEFYTRQLVVVDREVSAPTSWPKKIEFSDHVVATYMKAVVAAGESPKFSPLKTIAATPFPVTCGRSNEQEEITGVHDLLVFPDGIRVQNVTLENVPSLVSKLLQPKPNVSAILDELNLVFQPLAPGHHILVCAHASRDERCGCNGPKLLRWLEDVGSKRNVPLHLYSSSHFGGHRYAANCIAYPSGNWFGLLNEPSDADALIAALEDQEPLRLEAQWRGRIGLKKEEQIQTLRDAVDASP